jgi:uncharacterized membrane-anchored protein YhcB (DUF1043 family)
MFAPNLTDFTESARQPDEFTVRWAGLVARFNEQVAAYADASWFPQELPRPEAVPSLAYLNALSSALISELGLADEVDWAVSWPSARFFLMDAPAREAMALVVGIAAQRNALRQVVQLQQLQALHHALGDYREVLWSPLAEQVPHAEKSAVALSTLLSDPQALRRRLVMDGLKQLLRLLDAKDPQQSACARRARLLIPKQEVSGLLPSLPTLEARALGQALIAQVVPKWIPQWNWLF